MIQQLTDWGVSLGIEGYQFSIASHAKSTKAVTAIHNASLEYLYLVSKVCTLCNNYGRS